jgi:hypothetical protein
MKQDQPAGEHGLPQAAAAGDVTRREFMQLFGAGPALLFAGAGAVAATAAAGTAQAAPAASTPIPDDVFIIDAVAHAYNVSKGNIRNRYGEALAGLI